MHKLKVRIFHETTDYSVLFSTVQYYRLHYSIALFGVLVYKRAIEIGCACRLKTTRIYMYIIVPITNLLSYNFTTLVQLKEIGPVL